MRPQHISPRPYTSMVLRGSVGGWPSKSTASYWSGCNHRAFLLLFHLLLLCTHWSLADLALPSPSLALQPLAQKRDTWREMRPSDPLAPPLPQPNLNSKTAHPLVPTMPFLHSLSIGLRAWTVSRAVPGDAGNLGAIPASVLLGDSGQGTALCRASVSPPGTNLLWEALCNLLMRRAQYYCQGLVNKQEQYISI